MLGLLKRHGIFAGERGSASSVAGSYSTEIVALMTCVSPCASVTAFSAALHVSTQQKCNQASSPRSASAFAFSTHGFQTTVLAEPVFATMRRRPAAASSTVQTAVVFR